MVCDIAARRQKMGIQCLSLVRFFLQGEGVPNATGRDAITLVCQFDCVVKCKGSETNLSSRLESILRPARTIQYSLANFTDFDSSTECPCCRPWSRPPHHFSGRIFGLVLICNWINTLQYLALYTFLCILRGFLKDRDRSLFLTCTTMYDRILRPNIRHGQSSAELHSLCASTAGLVLFFSGSCIRCSCMDFPI